MRLSTLVKRLLGVDRRVVVEGAEFEVARRGRSRVGEAEVLVVRVRPDARWAKRCGVCRSRCPGYDGGRGRRRWRGLDLGVVQVYLEAPAPRVRCPEHGVVVAAVPWARHGSSFTTGFEDTCAWLTARASMSAVARFLRTTWRSVDAIVGRVVAELAGGRDMLGGLRRIGIDELAHRKGHRYITVVIDHDTGRIVWARRGRSSEVVNEFLDALGAERTALLTHLSADGAEWIHAPFRARAPQVAICLDPFHVVAWATEAVEKVRRRLAAQLRRDGRSDQAATIKHTRWALIKDYRKQTPEQRGRLAEIAVTNKPLYRAYLIKEQLREAFTVKGEQGKALVVGVIAWCARSRLPEFVKLGATLRHYRDLIWATFDHGLSNAASEATNTHLRVLTRGAYGFHTPEALISRAMLTRGGLCPELPGRAA